MRFLVSWFATILVVTRIQTCIAQNVVPFAQECFTNNTLNEDGNSILRVTNPGQLTVFQTNCTTLHGDFVIASTFRGTFLLRHVINFTGRISTDPDRDCPDLVSVSLWDTVYLRSLDLFETTGLEHVQLSVLESADCLSFTQPKRDSWFQLWALKEANQLRISGVWDRATFEALERVADLSINVPRPAAGAKQIIELPRLTDVGSLDVSGWVNGLSLPRLQHIGEISLDNDATPRGMRVDTSAAFDAIPAVDLSNLQTLNGSLSVIGNISILNLGPMEETTAEITVTAKSPMRVYSNLTEFPQVTLQGEIASIDFPNANDSAAFSHLAVNSTVDLDCGGNILQWFQSHNNSFCGKYQPPSINRSNRSSGFDLGAMGGVVVAWTVVAIIV